jgi:site-specific DNA-cytosine methylase
MTMSSGNKQGCPTIGIATFAKARRPGEHDPSPETWKETDTAPTVDAAGQGPRTATAVVSDDLAVRRLTPLECERLQGLPDNWTDDQKDSPRYRQIGNGVAVPALEWIARRIVAWETLNGA